MSTTIRWRALPALFSVLFFVSMGGIRAQDGETTKGWKDSAELSFVKTDGNTDTSTLGFKNRTWRRWERQAVEFRLGGVRAESADSRFAIQQPGGGFLVVEPEPKLTAESYYVDGKYFREIRKELFWQAGAGWTRDEFAGVENRYVAFAGVGNIWVEKEKMKWRTDYSLSFTDQEDVIENPDTSDSYLGIRATSNFELGFGKSSSYGNDTILDLNLDDTDDWRVDMTNWVAVTMTTHLALKVSLQWRYDDQPSLEEIVVVNGAPGQTVTTPLDELDTILTASLVVNF